MADTVVVTTRISQQLVEQIDALVRRERMATGEHVTRAKLIERAIKEFVSREDNPRD